MGDVPHGTNYSNNHSQVKRAGFSLARAVAVDDTPSTFRDNYGNGHDNNN